MKLKNFLLLFPVITFITTPFSDLGSFNHVYNLSYSSETFLKSSSARMYGYKYDQHKKIYIYERLEISMTPQVYTWFLAFISKTITPPQQLKEQFILFLLGPQLPRYADWKSAQIELKSCFKQQSLARGLESSYFSSLFLKWMMSPTGWSSFKSVFMGDNLKNNIYRMPAGYTSANARLQFRREGAILQFDFLPKESQEKTWIVDNRCRVFPYTVNTVGLKYYHQNIVKQEGIETFTPPIIKIHWPSHENLTIGNISEQIMLLIFQDFNIENIPTIRTCLVFPRVEKNKTISWDPQNSTLANLGFYSWSDHPYLVTSILYITKPIKLYLAN